MIEYRIRKNTILLYSNYEALMNCMDSFTGWLISSFIGFLAGLLPGYGDTGSILHEAVLVQKKKVARWLNFLFKIDPERPEVNLSPYGPRRGRRISRYLAIIYVVLIIGIMNYVVINDLMRGNTTIFEVILLETSLPAFLLLTWLLPVHFMRRYLKKLKPGEDVDRYTYYDYE